ncbi:hypothetical protein [Bacterioplanoides sp.]|uniref:hypothetical protein n=1 Tax=Bacterioplanoides sp. TaxID=2066072 RepID=UPI003B5CA877
MSRLQDIVERIKNYQKPLISNNGCAEVGRFHPDDEGLFESGCLHCVYDPIPMEKIELASNEIRRKIPDELKEFYIIANGLDMFCSSLYLKGSLAIEGVQPISILYQNIIDLPTDHSGKEVFDEDHIYIGGYASDKSNLKINIHSGVVTRELDGNWGVVENSWATFEDFLCKEFQRLSTSYEKTDGKISFLHPIPAE